ncbi:MAG: hypothetical protein GY862_28350 [Gammaproteobacteria bacterium]|nr:hypothetical protein [Gammaproteobacteria bacterium]
MSTTTQYHSIQGISAALTLLAMLALPYNAAAGPPLHLPHLADESGKKGTLWDVDVFHDPYVTQHYLVSAQVCFQYAGQYTNPEPPVPPVSTQDKYNWCLFGMKGVATKEGDQIFMHNDRGGRAANDAVQWELSSPDEGAGHWRYWANDLIFDLNVTFTRTLESCSCR